MTDSKGATGEWYKESHNIDGVLLDIYGVLYDAGVDGDVAIPGSVEALKKWVKSISIINLKHN